MRTITLTTTVKDRVELIKRNLIQPYKGLSGRVRLPGFEISYQWEGAGTLRVLDLLETYERRHFFHRGHYPDVASSHAVWWAALCQCLGARGLWLGEECYRFEVDTTQARQQAYARFKNDMRRLFGDQIYGGL